MTWPPWIEEIKTRYLANEASAFLLHGDIVGQHWTLDGEALDCVGVLEAFLRRTKPVVGVIRSADGLSFSGIGDQGSFERIVSAAEIMASRSGPLSDREPFEALGRVWLALCSPRTSDQAYILADVHALLPSHRKRIEPLGGDAPPLWDWCRDERIRASNNVLCLLTPTMRDVHSALVDVATPVHVQAPVPPPIEANVPTGADAPALPSPPAEADAPSRDAEAEIAAFLAKHAKTEATEHPPAPAGTALEEALRETLVSHPVSTWEQRLPVIDALARVLAARIPDHVGAITWSIDEEGAVTGVGTGAGWVLRRGGPTLPWMPPQACSSGS